MVQIEPNMPDPFEIIVGTYEQYMLGYKVENIVNEYKLERTFATHSHLASVRTVASNKHYLASGGADDSVYLYDMRYRVESGKLIHHNDTVNCIAFTPEASHLFTCSNDGTIAAIRCGNWQIEKHWRTAHKGLAVNSFAIHPTGKIALSTGADGILRTWNLVKGRQAYATNLVPRLKLDAKNVTVLKWSPNGEKYLLAVNQRIDVYSVDLAGIDDEIKFDSKIVCVEFLKDDLIAVGLENGQIKFYDLEKSEQTLEAVAHDIRVKCIAFKDDLLVTASSSGEIKLWKYTKNKLHVLKTVNCGARITCLSLAMSCKSLVRKEDVQVKDEEEVKEKRKLRLRQEVIVEDEGDWEVNPIGAPPKKVPGKKSEKKRLLEEEENSETPKIKKKRTGLYQGSSTNEKRQWIVEDVTTEQDSSKKKKKKKIHDKNDNVFKKRKESAQLSTGNTVSKKIKKFSDKTTLEQNTTTKQTKVDNKSLSPIDGNDDAPPKKKKKTIIQVDSVNLKKKKKKQRVDGRK